MDEAFFRQTPIIQEELNELCDAVRNSDELETLDGVVDVLFTSIEAAHILELNGFDVWGALKQVCENNLTKFTPDPDIAAASVIHHKVKNGVDCHAVFHKQHNLWSIVRSDGKILKPVGYERVDLKSFLPKRG